MPSRSTAIALLALFLAAGGAAAAAKKLIDGRSIKPRSITTSKLTKSAVKSLRRAAAQPVTGARIVDGTVTGADLAPRSVGNDQVVDRALTAGKLVADTITSIEIGVGAVGEPELAPDSVGESELTPNSVGNSEIRTASISRNLLRGNVIRVGRVNAAFTDIANGTCATATPDLSAYQLATDAFDNAVIEVEPPASAPAGLVVDGSAPDGSTLRIQVCNFSGAPQSVSGTFAFAAFGT